MIASLGMYDRPQAMAANDRYWALIRDGLRARGVAAPEALTRGEDAYWPAWTAPELVFSQTCGLPFRSTLYEQVTLIGSPDYGLPGCPPGHYNSVFVARKSDPRKSVAEFDGASFAFNEYVSQSGWAGPRNHAAAIGITLVETLESGAHFDSARAVVNGLVDIAAIDCHTWSMLTRWEPWSAELKELETIAPTPATPYITAKGADADLFFDVVQAAIEALVPEDRATLRLKGIVRVPASAYLAVPTPERQKMSQPVQVA